MTSFRLIGRRLDQSRKSVRRSALRIESLEQRSVLSGMPVVAYDAVMQMVTITGTDANDSICVSWNDSVGALVVAATSDVPMPVPPPQKMVYGTVKHIKFVGGNGDDQFTNKTSIICEAEGGAGNDVLRGGSAGDTLWGGAGNDTLEGRGGNDFLYGEDGNDTIDCGDGNDLVGAGAGNDTVRGGTGNDVIFGGLGDDNLYGGDGNDFLIGDAGNDRLYGENGADELHGSDGNDYLSGGWDAAVDVYYGDAGADSFFLPASPGVGGKVIKDYNPLQDTTVSWYLAGSILLPF